MNIDKWKHYYKISDGVECPTNLLYTPRMNQDGDILCMSWNADEPYQITEYDRPYYTQNLVDFFFSRECTYLTLFQKYDWCPKLIKIDTDKRHIFLEWNNITVNNILNTQGNLNEICPSWKDQMFQILDDVIDSGHYKMSLYPHCYFLDKQNKLKTFDFYACVEKSNPYVKWSILEGMIGKESFKRFNDSLEGDSVNFEKFFMDTIKNYIKWPDDALSIYYEKKFVNVE
jgi:hypothetical protein